MAEFKLVISDPKTGKTTQKEVKDAEAKSLLGLVIGETIVGDTIGFSGYEFLITGGSDHCGFPMRKDLPGTLRKKILAVGGVGIRPLKTKTLKNKPFQFHPGSRQRKTICGNTIVENTTQINVKITKEGKASLFVAPELVPTEGEAKPVVKEEAKPEAAPVKEEKKAAAPEAKPVKEEVKPEAAPAKEEKPAEEKKEAAAPEAKAEKTE